MRNIAWRVGVGAIAAIAVPFFPLPGIAEDHRQLSPPGQTETPSATRSTRLLEVEGVLEDGDSTLGDGSFYDRYTIIGRAGQQIGITLESLDFDTFLILQDDQGNELSRNDDINFQGDNLNSFIRFTLPKDGTYQILANGLDASSRGRYRLVGTVVNSGIAQPELSDAAQTQIRANQRLRQGNQDHSVGNIREALVAWEEALTLYREIGSSLGETNALNNLGLAYMGLSQYHQAIDYYEQSLALALRLQNRQAEANALNNLGEAHRYLSQYQRAIEYYEQSLAIAEDIDYRVGIANSLNNSGLAYASLSQYDRAIAFYEDSLAIAQASQYRTGEANALNNLGLIYGALSDYHRAIDYYEQSLAIAEETQNRVSIANALNNLGLAYGALSQYQRAEDFYTQALEINRTIGDRYGEATALSNVANTYLNRGQYQLAIDRYEDVLTINRDIQNQSGEANTLNNLGLAYENLGQYQQAIAFYQQARDLFQTLGGLAEVGLTLGNLGNAHMSLGQYPEAIAFHQQSLDIARSLGGRAEEARALSNLGVVSMGQGQYQQAIDYFSQAVEIFQAIEQKNEAAISLGNLGDVYLALGEYEQAIDYQQRALEMLRETGNRHGEAGKLNSLGASYLALEDYRRTIALFEESLAILRAIGARGSEGIMLGNLGYVYQQIGEYETAIALYEQGLAILREVGDRAGEGRTLGNLGLAYASLGDYEQAIDLYRQSLAQVRAVGNRAETGMVLTRLGLAFAALDNPDLAIVFLKASVDVRESIRGDIRGLDIALQQSFTETIAEDYRFLADLLLQQDRILEAQRVLDLLRVQELDEALHGVRSSSEPTRIAFWQVEADLLALYDQVMGESEELARLQAQDYDALSAPQQSRLAELRRRYAEVQDRFITFLDLPEVSDLLAQISAETRRQNLDIEAQHRALQNNLRELPQRTALLYPLILPDRLELVVITAEGPPLRYPIAVTATELNRAIVAFGQALKSPDSDIEPLAQELYGWLVAPLEEQLTQAGIESILYAPDGALRYVPLAALHDGQRYLAERFSLSHITAASLTNFSRVPQPAQRRVLAAACAECRFTVTVGDRTFPFTDLPFTEAEVKTLAEQVPDTRVLLNQSFTQAELEQRLGSYTIIHLATHGAVVENQPSQSFVLLGSGETVSLETIRRQWSLSHAELVVLSACETAVGNPVLGSGIEVLGLGYQIQEAGAQAVLASLWKVSDRGTQVLMTAFYQALAAGMTKAEALQAAQVALITGEATAELSPGGDRGIIVQSSDVEGTARGGDRGYRHPFYWAPFILIGNGL